MHIPGEGQSIAAMSFLERLFICLKTFIIFLLFRCKSHLMLRIFLTYKKYGNFQVDAYFFDVCGGLFNLWTSKLGY